MVSVMPADPAASTPSASPSEAWRAGWPASFRALIELWPAADALAGDIGVHPGVVRGWKFRDSIPSAWWVEVERAAKRRGFAAVTLVVLARLAAARRDRPDGQARLGG